VPAVTPLGPEHAAEVVSVIADAFTGYPVVRYVLGPEREDEHRERIVRLFVMARVLRGEPLLGIRGDHGLIAAGVVSFPGTPAPPAFEALRGETWGVLGQEAERRYAAYRDATATFAFPPGSVHLNMIGARRGHQRQGLGRAILEAVQEISRARPGSPGVELTTERLENVAYYERVGYEVVGHVQVAPGFESWGLFRPNDAGTRKA